MKWDNPKIVVSIIVICTVVGFLIGYVVPKTKEEAVARVNGEYITREQLYDEMVKADGEDTLNAMISKKLIELEIAKQNIVVPDEEVQTELQKYYDYYGGEDSFKQTLASSGYTLDEVKTDIANEMAVRRILEPQITITEEEMQSYFEENKTQFAQEGQEASYEENKDTIRETLLQDKLQSQYEIWIQNLNQQYSVENYLVS